ncbi:hypothetical protein TSUD_244610 [Trifolium subterraneum]|uniref:Uncharacterized protein n=1 Tax=Trifolium subterraneum TaxID=3900 RepID=A0A2Z6P1Y2_TRISU|nr:hypothetical protein TSUD_244610 [Trifolium subterraneum]
MVTRNLLKNRGLRVADLSCRKIVKGRINMSGGIQNSLRKALGALKDTTTVPLAKVNSDYWEKMVKICCIGVAYLGGPTMVVIALKCPEIEQCLWPEVLTYRNQQKDCCSPISCSGANT